MEQAMSYMSEEQETYVMHEQEREPEERSNRSHSEGREAKNRRSRTTRSSRAGLLFPVSRVDRQLRRGRFSERLGSTAPVYLAAVLQCVTHKALDVASKITRNNRELRISPSHLQMAVQKSSLLKRLMQRRKLNHLGPERGDVTSHSKKKRTKDKKKNPRQRAAPARANLIVK